MVTRRDWAKMVACWVASTRAPTRAPAFLQAPRLTSDSFARGTTRWCIRESSHSSEAV